MAILEQLGLNSTAFIQFALYIFTVTILTKVAFVPYYEALTKREKSTVGGEKLALEIQNQAKDLSLKYETEARRVNAEIKTIFDKYRDSANKEAAHIISSAKEDAQKLIEQMRAKVESEADKAGAAIREEASAISSAITNKLISR